MVYASLCYGGESPEQIRQRLQAVIDELSNRGTNKGHVILVTHGYPSQVLLELFGQPNARLATAEARVCTLN